MNDFEISEKAQKIADLFDWDDEDFEMLYDDLFSEVENYLNGNHHLNWIKDFTDSDIGDEVFNILNQKLGENMSVKTDTFEHIFESSHDKKRLSKAIPQKDNDFPQVGNGTAQTSASLKPKRKFSPAPHEMTGLKTSAVGKKDYEAKKGGRGGPFYESTKVGQVSPALQEALDTFNAKKHLTENGLVDKKDLDLLNESDDLPSGETWESYAAGDDFPTGETEASYGARSKMDSEDYIKSILDELLEQAEDLKATYPDPYTEINGDPVEHLKAIRKYFGTSDEYDAEYVSEQLARLDDAIGFTLTDLGNDMATYEDDGDAVGVNNLEYFFDDLEALDKAIIDVRI
jgi:hypothetical protein